MLNGTQHSTDKQLVTVWNDSGLQSHSTEAIRMTSVQNIIWIWILSDGLYVLKLYVLLPVLKLKPFIAAIAHACCHSEVQRELVSRKNISNTSISTISDKCSVGFSEFLQCPDLEIVITLGQSKHFTEQTTFWSYKNHLSGLLAKIIAPPYKEGKFIGKNKPLFNHKVPGTMKPEELLSETKLKVPFVFPTQMRLGKLGQWIQKQQWCLKRNFHTWENTLS